MEEFQKKRKSRARRIVETLILILLIVVAAIGILMKLGGEIQRIVHRHMERRADEGRQADEGRGPVRPRMPWG